MVGVYIFIAAIVILGLLYLKFRPKCEKCETPLVSDHIPLQGIFWVDGYPIQYCPKCNPNYVEECIKKSIELEDDKS